MSNIVQIGESKFRRKKKPGHCRHLNLTYCPDTQVIQCDDCDEYLSPWAALMVMTSELGRDHERRENRIKTLRELEGETLTLRAAKKVEKAWRSRTTVPTCPHCREAIFPQDGLGGACIGKEFALKRREHDNREG